MENKKFESKGKKFLAIAAHPDDVDFFAGGSVVKWLSEGSEVGLVVATNGDKGSPDQSLTHQQVAELRRKEQEKVSEHLGLAKTWFVDYPDAQLEVTQKLKSSGNSNPML
jgi:LmbE family N-acetylglucosaminyl deacetylase